LVTEIQKNHSDGSQDEVEVKKHPYSDRELIPWPKNFLLPPLVQLLEKKHGEPNFSCFHDQSIKPAHAMKCRESLMQGASGKT
jgi:hypothetical protein